MNIKKLLIIFITAGILISSVIGAGALLRINNQTLEPDHSMPFLKDNDTIENDYAENIEDSNSETAIYSNNGFEKSDCYLVLDEDFEDISGWGNPGTGFQPLPEWSSSHPSGYFWMDGSLFGQDAHSGSKAAYSFTRWDSMISPSVTLGDAGSVLSFWYRVEISSAEQSLEVYVNGFSSGTCVWVESDFNHETWVEAVIDLDVYAGQTIFIEFINAGDPDWDGLLIDDVRIETCEYDEHPDIQDIIVQKTVWDGIEWTEYAIVHEGEIVQFNVSIFNPYDYYQIDFSGIVFDAFPCHLTYIENSLQGLFIKNPVQEEIDWANNTVFWNRPDPIPPQEYRNFTYNARANCDCDIIIGSNNVTISPSWIINISNPEDIIYNNQYIGWNHSPEWWGSPNASLDVSDSAIVEVICEGPDLSVTKYVKNDDSGVYSDVGVFVGLDDPRWVTFKLVVSGNGSFDEVTVVDVLPYGLVSSSDLIWNLGPKDGVWSEVITFTASVIDGFCGLVTNMVTVTGEYGDDESIVSDSVWVDIQCSSDIFINKLVKPDCQDQLYTKSLTFNFGEYEDITYKLEFYTNISLISLSIRDTIPQLSGLEFVATYIMDTQGNFLDESEYEFTMTDLYAFWNFTYLPAESHFFIYYCAKVQGCGQFINNVTVEGFYYEGGPCCPTWILIEDSAVVNVICPSGLVVNKEASMDGISWSDDGVTAITGDVVWFRITVKNLDFEEPIYAVNVTDILPPHLEFDSFISTDGGSVINGVGWWQVFYSFIDKLDTKVIIFKARVVGVGDHRNVVVATSCGEDGVEDDAWVNVSHGISIRKTVSDDNESWVENITVSGGERVWWNVSIHFASEDVNLTLVHIIVKDWLPEGVSYVSGSGIIVKHDGWSLMQEPVINGRMLTWDLSSIPQCYLRDGEWLSVLFATDVNTDVNGILVNWGNVTARQCDGQDLSGSDNATLFVTSECLMTCEKNVRKNSNDPWVDEINAVIGDTVSFNISLVNHGPMPMYKIGVWDELPNNLEYKVGTAKVLFNGTYTSCPPDVLVENILFWDDICVCIPSDYEDSTGRYLMPGERVSVIFDVKILSDGIAINIAEINATMCNQGIHVECSDTATINVSVPPLVADAGGPYTAFIGDSVTLQGSANGGLGPFSYYWDLDNDGEYDDATGSNVQKVWNNQGTYIIGLKVIDEQGTNDTDTAQVTIKIRNPDLACYGSLHWVNISSGDTITGEFTIRNIGDPKSKLDWEITSTPTWGAWSFSPASGTDLTPEDGSIIVQVTVQVPKRARNEQFYGNITVINTENPSDSAQITISLATPKNWNNNPYQDFLQQFLQRFSLFNRIWESIIHILSN